MEEKNKNLMTTKKRIEAELSVLKQTKEHWVGQNKKQEEELAKSKEETIRLINEGCELESQLLDIKEKYNKINGLLKGKQEF